MAARVPTLNAFEINTAKDITTLSEIRRFVIASNRNDDTQLASGLPHLESLLKDATTNIHFDHAQTASEVTATLNEIVSSVRFEWSIDALVGPNAAVRLAGRKLAITEVLIRTSLVLANRLVVHLSQAPETEVVTEIQVFISGLKKFFDDHITGVYAEDRQLYNEQWGKIKENSPNLKPASVAPTLWENIKDFTGLGSSSSPLKLVDDKLSVTARQLNKFKQTRTGAATIGEEQAKEIEELIRLRKRLEGELGNDKVMIHRSPSHLFGPKAYSSAASEIEAVLGSTPSSRPHAILLMQKKFELLALLEISSVLMSSTECYNKIAKVLESGSHWKKRAARAFQQVLDLYWLQRRSINISYGPLKVDEVQFIRYLKKAALKDEKAVIEEKLHPYLARLEVMAIAKQIPSSSSAQLVFAAMTPWFQIQEQSGGGDTAVQVSQQSSTSGTEAHREVLKQREIVRALLRDTLHAAAKVHRHGVSLDAEAAKFVDMVMLPYLAPLAGLLDKSVTEFYLKPQTTEHDDKHVLAGTENKDRDAAFAKPAQQSLDRVAANLSSSSLFMLQILKAMRLFVQIGAAFVAQKVFNESYVRKVFSEGRDPPPLTSMLFLMLSIDATAHLMMVVILVLASFAFKTDTNAYLLDDVFLSEVLTEFAISSTVFIVIGMMIADIMRRKRYFQYADQGQIVSASFRSALLYVCAVNFVIPFSMLVS